MTTLAIAKLVQEVQEKLHVCTTDQLEAVSGDVSLPEASLIKAKAKGRLGLLGLLNRHLSSEELEESSDQGRAKIEELKEALDKVVHEEEATPSPGENEDVSPQHPIVSRIPANHQYIHRDFKIPGQITATQHKDGLGFTSLIHQIEAGLRKGYPEVEVVEDVIRATTLGERSSVASSG
ncbi:hypothetical protein HOLleu_06899 [Holothuria leucospilota]|uniref:Uncharacterized protein n=1 Tax=Holothuria leucospilota TaxID=206669 RepID=A0A9Q1CNK4_HOLLE|nr:hypothetical protein HOLleu_06899 [Holothuria leucospilota]